MVPPAIRHVATVLSVLTFGLLLLTTTTVHALSFPSPYNLGPALPAATAPNPQLQLQRYDAKTDRHVLFGTVFARRGGSNNDDDTWRAVGYVRSSLEDPTTTTLFTSVFGSVQCQRRLVAEYACRLHQDLRKCKNDMELGVRLLDDDDHILTPYHDRIPVTTSSIIETVPPCAEEGQPDDLTMSTCGFLGLLEDNNDGGFNSALYQGYFEQQAAIGTTITSKAEPAPAVVIVGGAAKHNNDNDKKNNNDKKNDNDNVTNNNNNNNMEEVLSSSGKVLSPEYYRSVYDDDTTATTTPWDIGGGRPQPAVVRAYDRGGLRGRILDAGCGAGENCVFLGRKFGVESVLGFDLAEGAVEAARRRVEEEEAADASVFRARPAFLVSSCTDVADTYFANGTEELFDVALDSGLLHCLSDADARTYVRQLARLVKPDTGRAFVGCFSAKNPDPWDNPRRLSEGYLRTLFCREHGWEVTDVRDTWWSRPPGRGSKQGSFCLALWMEARRVECV